MDEHLANKEIGRSVKNRTLLTRKDNPPVSGGICPSDRSAACAPSHKEPSRGSSTFRGQWQAPKLPRFLYGYPRIYGLFWEVRSFLHRSLLVWKRGGIRPLPVGKVFALDPSDSRYLI